MLPNKDIFSRAGSATAASPVDDQGADVGIGVQNDRRISQKCSVADALKETSESADLVRQQWDSRHGALTSLLKSELLQSPTSETFARAGWAAHEDPAEISRMAAEAGRGSGML